MFDLAKKQSVKKKPWVVRTDVTSKDNDTAQEAVDFEAAAPVLFVYFDANSTFQGAVICADKHKINIDSCVSNAVLSYIALFHVCQVGYNTKWMNLLYALEHILLGVPWKPKTKYVPTKLEKFINGLKSDE